RRRPSGMIDGMPTVASGPTVDLSRVEGGEIGRQPGSVACQNSELWRDAIAGADEFRRGSTEIAPLDHTAHLSTLPQRPVIFFPGRVPRLASVGRMDTRSFRMHVMLR